MIRPYKPSDRPAVLEIFHSNTPRWFHPDEQKDLEEFLDQHADTYFVVELDGVIAGSGGYHFTDEEKTNGRISWYQFLPEYHGKGWGTKVVQHSLEQLRKMPSLKTIAVWTSQMQDKFYARFGFKELERKKDFWGPGMDLVRMEMTR